ncbi:SGNH/GDSL hydrolase family protein [Pontibacter sp. SGAir0037]|uniref:SGNH/GDSL hydrolase family protein n=1 Tax=Pontibacter sp. SGAir0037 TaxID=2571030 RepID=UPI0010CD677D|nr:SGNH/GDSL hydrolase family protein [Pontibacter sp. SGAir0037]QCR25157.1 G-D-S-L family lipolytic protein [Pontibacter sp. SGAir0037]
MKKYFYKSSLLALVLGAFLSSCDPEIDTPASSAGQADFSKYVAVGNSLTAGFADNGLYREGQINSYPNILAQQFKVVGGGDFTQPLFTEAQANGSGYVRLTGFNPDGTPIITPVTTNLAYRDNNNHLTKYLEPVQNLGVPGIRMSDVTTPGYGSLVGNQYFERITPDATPLQTYRDRVAASDPTFFTMWLGNNDVLGYATSGGAGAQITQSATFQTSLDAMISALTSDNNTKGAIINIPDVTAVPFFTAKPTAQLMQLAAAAGAKLYVTTGTGQVREATASDYVLLTSTVGTPENVGGNPVPHGFSQFNPLRNNEVLDNAEVAAVRTATTDFNAKLAAAAQAKGLALVDMNTFFTSIKGGFSLNGIAYSPAFISGNLFSLDGVHLTPRGYAIVANEIIKNINRQYNSTIPTVDETNYRAVLFP